MVDTGHSRVRDLPLAIIVSAFLAMVYLLTFSGQFRSIDEFAMYAQTESLAQGNGFNTPQLVFAAIHNQVGSLEPGQPLLAVPLYLLSQLLPGASSIAAVMLFNVFISALTGGVLFLLLRRLSFTQLIAVCTSLAWGLGTMAWPYARSFFREPLNGLVWISAALLCVLFAQTSKLPYALACIIVLCVGLAVKASSAVVVPVFAFVLLKDAFIHRHKLGWWRGAILLFTILAPVVFGLVLSAKDMARPIPSIDDYTAKYSITDSLLRVYGVLFSPVKGMIFYSPVIIAAAIGWPKFIKNRVSISILIIGAIISVIFLYSGPIFNAWHGGSVVWGPRYELPLLPLMLLPLASAFSIKSFFARIWVGIWGIAALVVQLAVGTASWSAAVLQMQPAYQSELLVGLDGIPWYSYRLLPRSPALVQVLQWQPGKLDMLWLRTLVDGTLASDKPLAIMLLTLTIISFVILVLFLSGQKQVTRFSKWIAVGCGLLVLTASAGLLVRSGRDTNDYYGLSRADARQLAQVVSAPSQLPFSLVFVSNDFFINYWLGLLKGHFITEWYSPNNMAELKKVKTRSFDKNPIWLVIDHVHMPPDVDPSLSRQRMSTQAYEIGGQWVGGFEIIEYLAPVSMTEVILERSWDIGIQLDKLATDTQQLHPGEALRIDLQFMTRKALKENLTLFVHLVPEKGTVIAGRDGEPQYGGAPTSTWKVNKTIILEKRAIAIPEDAKPGVYQIVCGWLEPGGEKLAPSAGQDPEADGGIVLATIEVLAD